MTASGTGSGCCPRVGVDYALTATHTGTSYAACFRTNSDASMLQDVEAGRPLELSALVGSVLDLASLTNTPAPSIRAVHAVTSLLAKNLQDRRATLKIG